MAYVAVLTEGELACVTYFETSAEADAYQGGVQYGSGLYAGDGCVAYTDGEFPDLKNDYPKAHTKAVRKMNRLKKLPPIERKRA